MPIDHRIHLLGGGHEFSDLGVIHVCDVLVINPTAVQDVPSSVEGVEICHVEFSWDFIEIGGLKFLFKV